MPLSNHCIDCDKVATVLDMDVPYCVKCYKENVYDKRTSGKKAPKAIGERL